MPSRTLEKELFKFMSQQIIIMNCVIKDAMKFQNIEILIISQFFTKTTSFFIQSQDM